jgi:nucleotide-binding universal stress UspA family protein
MSRRRGLGFSGAVLGRRGEHWPGLVHRPVRRSRACRLRLARRALSICAALGARLTPWPVEGRLPACAASLGEVDEVKRAKDESFRGVLERAGEQARRRRVQATTELVPGHAAEVIAHHASAHGHDLIVIGHRGHFLGDYLPGSVCVSACLAGAERSDDEVQGGDGAGDDGESAAVGVDLMGHLADVERGEGEHREPDHREEPMPSAPAQHSARQGQGEGDREGDQRGALGVGVASDRDRRLSPPLSVVAAVVVSPLVPADSAECSPAVSSVLVSGQGAGDGLVHTTSRCCVA